MLLTLMMNVGMFDTHGGIRKRRRWIGRSTDAFEQYDNLTSEEEFLEDIEIALSEGEEGSEGMGSVDSLADTKVAERQKHVKELSEAYQAYFESVTEALLFVQQRRLEIHTQTQAIALIIILS